MRWTVVVVVLAGLACSADVTLAAESVAQRQAPGLQEGGALHRCGPHLEIAVQAAAMQDAQAVCDGASRALDFMARAGLDGLQGTTVEVVPELPGELAGRALGCYLPETGRIFLLSFQAFEAGGGWFRQPPSWELYRAAAAHEVAHAVVGCHSTPRKLPVAAHEYVAYVVLFATMDPPLRAAILASFPGTGFKTTGQISDIQHIVNPNQFGVDAWRHYAKTRDQAQWLRRVVAGDVVLPSMDDPGASSR